MNTNNLLQSAEKALIPIFSGIDAQVKQNLKKVLSAFRQHRVGVQHFTGVSGYGHDDLGRETLDKVFASVMNAEAAAVRVQFVSGTHAIACALYGILRPGDEMLAVAGAPYDTLEEVIGIRGSDKPKGQRERADYAPRTLKERRKATTSDAKASRASLRGSLKDFGIDYRQLDLTPEGTIDWEALTTAVTSKTRLVLVQRSCGYSWRKSLAIEDIQKIVEIVKKQNSNTVCFVDNCYGEFIGELEPTGVGADLMAGSLIKNPGGTIVTAGGYVAGKAELVEAAACRLTAPGIGSSGGATFNQNRLMFQGLFLAPQMVGEAVKGSHLIAFVFDKLGYAVNPSPFEPRRDIIQAVRLGSPEKLIAFCKAIQQHSPVNSYLEPVPAEMPGYESQLVMAGGTFIDGSTSEFSADGPLREPYIAFCQGGTHWTHIAIALEAAIEAVEDLTMNNKQ